MLQRYARLLTLSMAIVLCAGCGKSYQIQVDSLSSGQQVQGTCHFIPASGKQDLMFQKVVDAVSPVFARDGIAQATTAQEATYIVELDYGVSEPQINYTEVTTPVYGTVGYTAKNRPIRGVVRYEKSTREHIRYICYVSIDMREAHTQKYVWQIRLASKNTSDDFRRMLPILVMPLNTFLGIDTTGRVLVRVDEKEDQPLAMTILESDGTQH